MHFLPLLSHARTSTITLWADVHLGVMDALVIFMYHYVGAYIPHIRQEEKLNSFYKGHYKRFYMGENDYKWSENMIIFLNNTRLGQASWCNLAQKKSTFLYWIFLLKCEVHGPTLIAN